MPIYEYQGKMYDIETTDHAEAKNKILAHLGTPSKVETPALPPVEASTSEGLGAGFLNRALGLSRSLGGDVEESQKKSQEAADVYSKINPMAVGLGGMAVDVAAAAPGLVAAAPLTAGMGLLGTMGVETALAGAPVGGAHAMERYNEVLMKTGSPEEAKQAAIASGVSGALGVGAPASLGGSIGKRILAGGAMNTAISEADIAAQNKILAGHKELQQEQFDPANMALNFGVGGVFGALGPKSTGKVAGKAEPTAKVDVPTEEITGASLVQRQVNLEQTKKKFLEQDIDNLTKQNATGDIGVEDRILLDQKQAELARVNENIAKLTGQEVGTPIPKTGINVPETGRVEPTLEGRVAGEQPQTVIFKYETEGGQLIEETGTVIERKGTQYIRWQDGTLENGKPTYRMIELEKAKDVTTLETTPKTDVEGPRIDEQPQGATVVSREEGVSPQSDVPPHLQLEDAAIDGVDPAKIIKEEPKTENQATLSRIDENISRLEDQRQQVEDLIQEYHENPNRNSPQDLNDLEMQRTQIESQLDGLYTGREKKVADVRNEQPDATRLTPEQRSQKAQEVIAEGVAQNQTPEQIAKRIVSVYAVEDKGVHYVGDSKLKKFITNTVDTLNKLTGLDDKVIVVHAPDVAGGKYVAIGNTHVLFVSDARKSNYAFLNTVPERLRSQAALTANIGHEYGHYFHVKLVQKHGENAPLLQQLNREFNKYVESIDPRKVETVSATPLSEGFLGKSEYARATGYFEKFPEYFAEQFNKALLHGTVPKNTFLKDLYLGLRKIANQVHKELDKLGIRVSKEDFTSQYFNEYFNSNRKYFEQSGKQMSDNGVKAKIQNDLHQRGQDKVPSAQEINDQLETFYKTESKDFEPINAVKVVEEQKKLEDIGWFSMRILGNAFGSPQLVQILNNVPVIRAVYQAVRNADNEASRIVKSIMEGTTSLKEWKGQATKKGFITSLKKLQDMDSPAIVMQKLHNNDFAALEQVFRQGFDASMDYAETLAKFGSHLTDDQKHAFTVLSDMFKKQYDEVVKLQQQMGKKNILPHRKGWYPSVRKGDFFIEINQNGVPVYRQQVRTLNEAERLAKLAKESGKFEGMEINSGKNNDTRLEAEQRDFIRDAIMQELLKRGESTALEHVEKLLDKIYERGGKLGRHHEQRMNILGYKGTELFGTAESRGLNFKEALDSSVKEYAGSLRKMMISRNTDAILKTPEGLDQSHPNVMEAGQLMADMAMSKTDSKISNFDNMVNQTFDKIFFKMFGKESRLPVYERVSGLLTHLFYTTTLTMKPAFWIGQALTSPTSLRHIFRETSLVNGLVSAGKGTTQLFKPSEDFLKCVYWLSQNTETYHPQFANELTNFKMPQALKDQSAAGRIVNFITGETPSQAADSFSRYWTSAMMFEHYKSKGLTGKKLYEAVSNATDSTMVQYGRRHRAPYLSKLGIVGEAMAPLHTFSTAQWGNFVADTKLALKTGNVKPVVATFLTTIMLGGVIGAPLVAEYEAIRKAFDLEDTLPSPVEWAVSNSPRALSHGVLSYSGFDLGSTMRWNPIVSGIVEANGTIADMFPAAKFVGKSVSNLSTMAKFKLGGDVSEAKYRSAVRGVIPKGPLLGLAEDTRFGATERSMVPTGGRGYGLVPQTGMERAADYLGTRTVTSALESKQFGLQKEQDQKRTDSIHKQIDIAVDALKSGDQQRYTDAIGKLGELGVPPDSVMSQIKASISNRGRGLLERFALGATGKGTSIEQQRKLQNVMEYYK